MIQIPEKLYYKIGEVSDLTKVKPYVLRYWESEFKILSPKKSLSRQRVYSRKDLMLILEIKKLLQKEKYTLEGVKKRIKEVRPDAPAQGRGRSERKVKRPRQMRFPFVDQKYFEIFKSIKDELERVKAILGT